MRPQVPAMAKMTASMMVESVDVNGDLASLQLQNHKGTVEGRGRTGQGGEDLFRHAKVLHQSPRVPQPTLRCKGKVEEDGGDAATGYEEGLQALGANVGDVGDALAGAHGGVMVMALELPDNQHGQKHACDFGISQFRSCSMEDLVGGSQGLTEPGASADKRQSPYESVSEERRYCHGP